MGTGEGENTFEVRLARAGSEEARAVEALEARAFLPEELPAPEVMDLLARAGTGRVAFYDERGFVGYTMVCDATGSLYIAFLAVDEDRRSEGLGSRILAWVDERAQGRPRYLEAEVLDDGAPNAAQRRARMAFYGRNGYEDTGYVVHEGDLAYSVLAKGPGASIEDYVRAVSQAHGGERPQLTGDPR